MTLPSATVEQASVEAAAASTWRRLTTHPRAMLFTKLVVLVLVVNVGVLIYHLIRGTWAIADGSALRAISALTVVNFAVTVFVRQQHLLNVVYAAAARTPLSWPLWARRTASRIHHTGGVHMGAALAGTGWLIGLTAASVESHRRDASSVSLSTLLFACALVALTLIVVVCALPPFRARSHNVFEHTHRWGGWAAIVLFWAVLVSEVLRTREGRSVVQALASEWQVWVLLAVTMSLVQPWLRLRRVPVSVQRLSSHAALLTFDYGRRPPVGAARAISRSPLAEWHSFASLNRTDRRKGFRLLISRAGDWTGELIDHPPTHVWVRGTAIASPLARVEALYHRVVYVVTGSGIGPVLATLLTSKTPTRLVWSVRDPRTTYGDAFVDEILAAQPDALIWDTTANGRIDILPLAQRVCREFDAEAAFVVSNKPTTWRVVHGLEQIGLPALSPIFDS